MTRTTWFAALCALVLVASAVVAGFLVTGSDPDTSTVGATGSATPSPTPTISPTSTAPQVTTPTPTPVPADVTLDIARSALPHASADYALAAKPVELSAICSGAVLDLGSQVAPAFISLETIKDPLRFLDVAIGVYEDSPTAAGDYAVLAGEINECPTGRTVTPTPAGTQRPEPVTIDGSPRTVQVGSENAVQWVQLQTSTAPATSLRTAITVFVFHNAIVAVSMDQDSETVTADALAEASRVAAEAVLAALVAAGSAQLS